MIELVVSPTSFDFIKRCDFCDSFIIGEENFGLRLAHYFSHKEIIDIIDLCQSRNQKVYLAVNKIIHEDELDKFTDYINTVSKLNIEGIIFGDLAVYQIARKFDLIHKLVYNPETYITNYESVRFFAKKGIKRVSLAKEITLEDITTIANKKDLEIEILAHGAINMFHSMRNLVTNYFRFLKHQEPHIHHKEKLFLLEEKRDDKYPIIEDQNGTHVFNSYDLCTINYLDRFIENNVTSLRIDGLFKTDNVLFEITRIYKQAIEDYYTNKDKYTQNKETYLKQLNEIENIQPFNEGFLFKKTIYK